MRSCICLHLLAIRLVITWQVSAIEEAHFQRSLRGGRSGDEGSSPQRLMLHTAIIPERDRVRLPAKSTFETLDSRPADKHLERGVAPGALELEDSRREHPIDEKQRATRDRMRSHYRMFSPGILR